MKRHIILLKHIPLANALLKTGRCKNEGNWIFSCEDDEESIQILQSSSSNFFKNTTYANYKLCFANPNNYNDFITIK